MILTVSLFFSCKTETDNYDLEAAALVSETGSGKRNSTAFAVQTASIVIHYKQKVLKNLDDELYVASTNDGFERAEAENKSVEAFTKLNTLAKNYQGFSYDYAVQKDSTIYIYYTRNEVVYSFYKDANTLSKQVRGIYGLTCTPPDVLIGQNVVTKWNSSPDGSENEIPAEFGAVDASYYANGTGIGTKYSPNAAGDIVFTDGTAATTKEVRDATGDQKNTYTTNALAVIIFDHYDAYTGDPNNGKKVIGVGVRAFNTYPNYFNFCWRHETPTPEICNFSGYFGYYELEKLKLFCTYEPSWDRTWSAIYRSTCYIDAVKEKCPSLNISERVEDKWYLPCWRELGLTFAKNYKYYQILKDACKEIDNELFNFFNTEGNKFWANPHQSYLSHGVYAAYIKTGSNYFALNYTVDGNTNQWQQCGTETTSEDYNYILPYREFK